MCGQNPIISYISGKFLKPKHGKSNIEGTLLGWFELPSEFGKLQTASRRLHNKSFQAEAQWHFILSWKSCLYNVCVCMYIYAAMHAHPTFYFMTKWHTEDGRRLIRMQCKSMMCKIGAMRLAPSRWEAHSTWGGLASECWCMTIPTYNLFAEWRKRCQTTWNHVVIPEAASLDARASCWQVPQWSECTSLHLEVSLEFSGSVCSPPHTSCHVEHLWNYMTNGISQSKLRMFRWIVAQELDDHYITLKPNSMYALWTCVHIPQTQLLWI